MTDPAPDRAHGGAAGEPRTPERLVAGVALQREQLAGTVDQLAAKLDLTSQARRRLAALKDSATTGPRTKVLAAAGSLVAMAVVPLLWRRPGDR